MAARPGWFAHRDAELIGGAAAADRLRPRGLSHVLLAAVLLFMAAFLAWARWATLDEVTRGDARVIPSRQIQVVQNLEGGIIAAILVREVQVVDEDQVLMRIDNGRAVGGGAGDDRTVLLDRRDRHDGDFERLHHGFAALRNEAAI